MHYLKKSLLALGLGLSFYAPASVAQESLPDQIKAWLDEHIDINQLEQWIADVRSGAANEFDSSQVQQQFQELFSNDLNTEEMRQSFNNFLPENFDSMTPEAAQQKLENAFSQNLNWDSMDWDEVTAPMNGYLESVLSQAELSRMKELLGSMKGSTQAERSANFSEALSEQIQQRMNNALNESGN